MKITITESRASIYDNLYRTFLHNESKWFSCTENLVIYAIETTRVLLLEKKIHNLLLKTYPNHIIDTEAFIFHQHLNIYKKSDKLCKI